MSRTSGRDDAVGGGLAPPDRLSGAATPALARLQAAVCRELALTRHPEKAWMPPPRERADGQHIFDVVIVGAGQGGLALAFALMRARVDNITLIDRAPCGREGVWQTYARMPHLRSPKEFTGPDLGMPSLTYEAWHEARFGAGTFAGLHRIAREHWAEYLMWVRVVLELPVKNDVELVAIEAEAGHLRLMTRTSSGDVPLRARRIVLATGQDGLGRWSMPGPIAALPAHVRATTADDIDFAAHRGKAVAVIGQGASAADNAAAALEAGARTVHLLVRRPKLQRVQPYLWLTFAGFLRHIGEMDDAWRWRFMRHILELRESIPQDTYDRCRRHDNFEIHVGAGVETAEVRDGRVALVTGKGPLAVDYVIAGTGIEIDPAHRPELASFAAAIVTWEDRYTPPAGEDSPRLARFPYHAPDGSLLSRDPALAPLLSRIHDFTVATTMSFGPSGCSINAMTTAVPKLAAGITRALFAEDLPHHWDRLAAYEEVLFEPAPRDRDKA